jgi:hypothetical protein
MAGWQISSFTPGLNNNLPLPRFQILHDNLRGIPAGIEICSKERYCEEYFSIGEKLRAIQGLVRFRSDQSLRFASCVRNPDDTLRCLSKDNLASR